MAKKPKLTEEQRSGVHQHNGLIEVEGEDGRYILMSMEVYREVMGVGTDEAMAESLAAIQRGNLSTNPAVQTVARRIQTDHYQAVDAAQVCGGCRRVGEVTRLTERDP